MWNKSQFEVLRNNGKWMLDGLWVQKKNKLFCESKEKKYIYIFKYMYLAKCMCERECECQTMPFNNEWCFCFYCAATLLFCFLHFFYWIIMI